MHQTLYFGKPFPKAPSRYYKKYYMKFENRGPFHAQQILVLASDQKVKCSNHSGRTTYISP